MQLDINAPLPDGVKLKTGNPESVNLDSDKKHVIMRFAVKQIDDDPHAELKQQYERDVETCATIDDLKPWRLWQFKESHYQWSTHTCDGITWHKDVKYRRHPHADSIIEYHQCSDDDKKRWQYNNKNLNVWVLCKYESYDESGTPLWNEDYEYRLKPRTISVTLQNGDVLEFPEPVREPLENGDCYWFKPNSMYISSDYWHSTKFDFQLLADNRMFLTKEDCQAAQDALNAILSQRSE
jgi:hypothetical protein